MELTAAAQWLNETFATFDYVIMEFFHNLHVSAAGAFFDPVFNFITSLGNGGMFFIVLSIVLMFFKKTRKAGLAMLAGIIVGSGFTNITIKNLVMRPRPYIDEASMFHEWWVSAGSQIQNETSFPSGHTTSAMAAMTGLFFVTNKKVSWTAFFGAILMGITRIYICVHYPSDVLGGLIVGFVAGLIGALIIIAIYKKTDTNKGIRAMAEFDIIESIKKKSKKSKA